MKPINKQNLYNSSLTILGALFGVAGVSIFIYLQIEVGNGGLRADALHSSGRITDLEIGTAILMVILIVASVICFRLIKDMSAAYKRRLQVTTCVVVAVAVVVPFIIGPFFTYR